jgi:hypothetical protein
VTEPSRAVFLSYASEDANAAARKSIREPRHFSLPSALRANAALGVVLTLLLPRPAQCQLTPAQITDIRNAIGDRIEALTILGGDFGLAGASFRSTGKFSYGQDTDATLGVSKLGGAGDIGDPQPLGNSGVRWQPRLQGNMGRTEATDDIQTGVLQGDVSKFNGYGIEFGGGARFWLSNAFSVAPSVMGLYGHSTETYTANSAVMRAYLPAATQLGLVNWSVDTWSLVAGLGLEYVFDWNRTIIALSSTPTYFQTQRLSSSNVNVKVNGDSGVFANKVDVDVPLGMQLFGQELRTGGYLSYSALYGGLKSGLNDNYINEVHGRLVLDYLNQLWEVQWIGIGASYLWGSNISGWTFGAELTFRF